MYSIVAIYLPITLFILLMTISLKDLSNLSPWYMFLWFGGGLYTINTIKFSSSKYIATIEYISISDEMCSIVAIYLEELNLIVFMVYRPPPNNNSIYRGDKLVRSFNDIVVSNINKVIGKFQAPTPDIILTGDFNFPKALWDAGMGTVQTDDPCNRKSLQQLIDLASRYNLLQTVTEGTRVTRSGHRNILELMLDRL